VFNGKKVGFMKINEKIKHLREGKHWSQEGMAQKLNMSKNGYAKMILSADPKDVDSFLPVLRKKFSGAADFFISKPFFLEVMPPGCGKGEAIAFLSDRLGIDRNETMAFGDSMNDESMIRMSGHGVAMLNGLAAIRDAAAAVTRETTGHQMSSSTTFLSAFLDLPPDRVFSTCPDL